MEMNTRLQVEHPVSEEVTGIDLVRSQLRARHGRAAPAPGHRAGARPRDRVPHQRRGSARAASCRRPGPLRRFRPPLGRGVRVDTHAYEGYTVPPTYDSLVAKLIVSDDDRPSALARAAQALDGVRGRGHRDDAAAVPRDGHERAGVPRRASTRPPISRRRRGGYPRCPRDDRYPAACGLAAPGAPRGLRPALPARRAAPARIWTSSPCATWRTRAWSVPAYTREAVEGVHARPAARSTPPSTRPPPAGRPIAWARSSARSCGSRPGSCAAASCPPPSSSTRPSSSRSATRGPRRRRS